jgi:hypothetical protein
VALARVDKKKAEEDAAKEFAKNLTAGQQWVAVDCD